LTDQTSGYVEIARKHVLTDACAFSEAAICFADRSCTVVKQEASKSRIVFASINPASCSPCAVLCTAPRASLTQNPKVVPIETGVM
jgi:hypothetical protein